MEFARVILLAGFYFGCARAGLELATLNQSVSPVWPATGFAIAIVVAFGRTSLISVFVGALVANYLVSGSLPAVISIAFGNTLEALVGALLIRYFFSRRKKYGFSTGPIAYVTSAAIGGACSATVGVAALSVFANLPSDAVATLWTTWWLGDALGALVVCPLLLQLKKFRFEIDLLPAFLLTLFAMLGACVFVFLTPQGTPYLFLLFPLLLLACLTLGRVYVLGLAAAVSLISVLATVGGHGPFAIGNLNERLIHLQLFLAAYALTALALSALGRAKYTKEVILSLICCWFVAGTVFHSFDSSERKLNDINYSNLTDDLIDKTEIQMKSYEQVLTSAVALYAASKKVDTAEWEEFTRVLQLKQNFPGLSNVGVVWQVSEKDIGSFQREIQRQLKEPFLIHGVPGTELRKNQPHYIVKFIAPMTSSRAALALDLSTDPNRRHAAELARDTGKLTASSKLALVQDKEGKPAVILLMPIYKSAHEPQTVEERRAAILGWAYAPIRYSDLFDEVLKESQGQIEMQIFEGESAKASSLVFSNFSDARTKFDRENRIRIGQRTVLVRWAKSDKFQSTHNTIVAWVGFCGALASLLLTGFLITAQNIGFRAGQIASELTKELSESREKAREGERRLLYALDGSQDGIWDWNIIKGEMYVSGKIAEKHGWPQRFPVRTAEDLSRAAHADDLQAINVSIANELAGRTNSYEVETRYRMSSGEWRWVLTRGRVSERDVNGRPTRMTGVHIDIHQRKMAQLQMEEAQSQMSAMANSVPTMISLWNKDFECQFANEPFCAALGLGEDRILGVSMKEIFPSAEFDARVRAIQSLKFGEEIRFERESRRRSDGAARQIIATYKLNESAFETGGFFLFIQDVTDMKQAELKAIEGERAAKHAANIKSQFLANMSHEIRTPLNGVIGVANLLLDTQLNDLQKEYSEVIAKSSHSLLGVINDILDFSKIEAGKLSIEATDFELRSVVSEVVSTLSVVAMGKGLEIETEVADAGPSRFVGDPGRIRQVLLNLLGNALKFTAVGKVSLMVNVVDGPTQTELRFEVIDTGIGIAEDAIGNMFQSFTQADSSTTRRFGGTGLGLSISKQLVELMGGTIGVRSRVGIGSTFTFGLSLPRSIERRAKTRAPISGDLAEAVKPSRSGHLLIVEDNKVNQLVISKMVTALNFTYDIAETGVEAVKYASEKSYALILMDCQLPEMDGFEATRLIRQSKDAWTAKLPIIALTANAMSGDKERCLEAGMDDYLSKPIDRKLLAAALDHWLTPLHLRASG